MWRFCKCKIDGRVLGGMPLRVLLEECGRPGVLFEVLVRNPLPGSLSGVYAGVMYICVYMSRFPS